MDGFAFHPDLLHVGPSEGLTKEEEKDLNTPRKVQYTYLLLILVSSHYSCISLKGFNPQLPIPCSLNNTDILILLEIFGLRIGRVPFSLPAGDICKCELRYSEPAPKIVHKAWLLIVKKPALYASQWAYAQEEGHTCIFCRHFLCAQVQV